MAIEVEKSFTFPVTESLDNFGRCLKEGEEAEKCSKICE